eukprot:973531-Pleurochrysis_carterae.AAC.1
MACRTASWAAAKAATSVARASLSSASDCAHKWSRNDSAAANAASWPYFFPWPSSTPKIATSELGCATKKQSWFSLPVPPPPPSGGGHACVASLAHAAANRRDQLLDPPRVERRAQTRAPEIAVLPAPHVHEHTTA